MFVKCNNCGVIYPDIVVMPLHCLCGNVVTDESKQHDIGLGDYTEQLLSTIGVTKDRYAAAKELFGLAPTCNCETRKAWLNKVGAWLGL